MNYNDKYIVELAKSSIFDKNPEEPKEPLDWDFIFSKSIEQNIAGLLFPVVNKLEMSCRPNDEIMDKWRNIMISTIGQMSNRYNEFLHMNKLMREGNIAFIGLKGCVVRNLYPVPELRAMGDFDILTSPEAIAQIKDVFKENGYSVEKDAFGIVCKSSKVYWEIFTTSEEEMRVDPKKWDSLFFGNTQYENNICRLNNTYFLIHLLVHTAKHCLREGSGIRNLCDIALFVNRYKDEIDFEVVKIACEEQKVFNIFTYIINAIEQWFDIDISDIDVEYKDTDKFVEYMLLNGIFGKHGNSMVSQAAKHEDDSIDGIRKMLFPTVKMLDYRYKYLKKCPFLLPVAWVQRIFSALFKWKYSFRQMAGDMKEAIEFSEERKKWLNELELVDKE